MLLRSTAPHINKYSLKPYTEIKKTKRKKTQNVPNQNSIGSALRRESTERRKIMKNLFCVFMWTDFLLRVFYTERRKKKNNLENFLNQIHKDLFQEVQDFHRKKEKIREKKHKMPQMKIL